MSGPEDPAGEQLSPPRALSSGRRALAGLAVLGFAIPVASYFWLIHHYGVNDVYLDQWGDVGILRHSYSGTLTLGTLWAQHDEQRVFFPNLIVLALGYTTHLNIVIEEYISATLLCLSALLLILSHKRRSLKGWLWYCPVPILMLSLVQSYSALFGFQLAWYLLISMLAVALYLLDSRSQSNLTLAGAMVAAVVGSFSSVPGLFIWPVGLILLYQRRYRLQQAIAWCLAAIVAVCVFAYHYNANKGVPSHLSGFDLPQQAVETFFRVIGSVLGLNLAHTSGYVSDAEILFGILVFLIACYAVVTRGLSRDDSSGAPVGVALICFGVLYSASFAYGRAWAGPVLTTQSQYTTFTILIVAGIYLALLDPPVRQLPIGFYNRKVGRAVAAVLAGAICLQVVLGTINGLRVASPFHAEQVESDVVLVDVHDVPDPTMQSSFASWWLPPSLVRSYAEFLELHRLSVFDSGNVSALRQQAGVQQKAGAFKYTAPPTVVFLDPHVVRTVKGNLLIVFIPVGVPHLTSVAFRLVSGPKNVTLGDGTLSEYGWHSDWNSTDVPNGTYQIRTTLHDERGETTSAPVTVVVDNPEPKVP